MKNKNNSLSSTAHEVEQYQYLFDNLANARNQKQAIINNQGAYYYQVWVKDVHKTMFRHSKSHLETRFDHGRYNADIANADQKINKCKNAVNSVQNKYNNQLAALITNKKTNTQEHNNLKTDIAKLKAQIQAAGVKENQLNDSIIQNNTKLLELKTLNEQAKIALSQISELNTEVKNKHQEVTAEAENIKAAINELTVELSQEEQEIYDQLKDISESQLAEFIAEFFNQPEFSSQLEIIKKMSFDADYLAYLAVEKNQNNLLELALKHGANCTTCSIKNQTILQKAIEKGNDEIISQIVKSKDCENVLLNAIKEDDLVTFNKIISADDSYLSKTYYGLTLLQISISSNKIILFDKLLSLDVSCVSHSSTQGESAFKLALSSGNEEIIQKLIPHINIEQELANITSDIMLLQKALEILELPYNTLQSLLEKSIKSEDEALIQILVDKGANLDLLLEDAIAHHDYVALQNLIIFDSNYLELIEQHADIFTELTGIINQQANNYEQI